VTTTSDIALRFVAPDDPAIEAEIALRFRVLRDPLGLPPDAVRFDFEAQSVHLLAFAGSDVVGCVLFHPEGDAGRLYQMAVAPEHQGSGVGRRLVERLETRLRGDGIVRVELHARDAAVGFYQRLGYRNVGEPFIEVGISHQRMRKALTSP
jgi:ribosomal protein S18 acetylase RimI-like enzyme